MHNLNTEITNINKIGAIIAKRLKRIGIENIKDLLLHFPFRYDDFSNTTNIIDLEINTNANIVGVIELIQNKRSPRRKMNITEAIINDGTEQIKSIWFNQPFIAKNLKTGDRVSLTGKIEEDFSGKIIKSPTYEKIYHGSTLHTQGIIPNYYLTANITQKQIRYFIKQIVNYSQLLNDPLPSSIIKSQNLLPLHEAIKKIHFPENFNDVQLARRRLAFDEIFIVQLQSQISKIDNYSGLAEKIIFQKELTKRFVDSLPFKLTDAQRSASWDILQDMEKNKPMSRLLEGDVGSGKTIVAMLAILNVVANGKQAVFMVPTEILASQHFETICKMISNFNFKICLLTSSRKDRCPKNIESPSKKMLMSQIESGEIDIIIGTHALIQESLKFCDLGLAIIDEQHRFGVGQRKEIMKKSGNKKTIPHLLSMTATPIPRSLALALYGDLDISIINQMPKGRKQIITNIIKENKRSDAYNFIKQKIKEGQQAFVICPLIDLSLKLETKTVKEEYQKLKELIFPELSVGMLHGKMKAEEKSNVMDDFLNNRINILVSTSVIEVGIDVPNATIMMIESAERFGLAQLHQFRGRVGRSEKQSYCFLFTDSHAKQTIERLSALVKNNDGFSLAKIDLKFRGPGEVFGTAQKGFPEFKVASLFDYDLINSAREEAIKIIEKDKYLTKYPKLKEKLADFEKIIHLE